MNYANRNITEFLEREFDSNPGHPPKYNSERRLLEYVDDNKFQKHLTPRQNMKILIRRFSNPHAEDILNAPTFIDMMHSHDCGSTTYFTDYFYDTLVDFENWAVDSIQMKIQEEFRTNARQQLSFDKANIVHPDHSFSSTNTSKLSSMATSVLGCQMLIMHQN